MHFPTFLMSVESEQLFHEAIESRISSSMNVIKNETLYNLSLESPLLREADLLDNQSITKVWRGIILEYLTHPDASLGKRAALAEWVTQKVEEGAKSLERAEEILDVLNTLETEARHLDHLGEIAL